MVLSLLLAVAPSLPAPFDALEATCIVENCPFVLYAPKGMVKFSKPAPDDGSDVTVGVVTIAPNVKRCLVFSPGPSLDPSFQLYPEKECTKRNDSAQAEFELGGEQFIVTGTGAVYAVQNTNTKFRAHHKAVWTGKALKLVTQPFLYVGERVKVALKNAITDEAQAPVPLYAEKKVGSDIVVTLAPGASVEILLAEKGDADWFLVRTEFGLVGWHHSPGGNVVPDALGLTFHGD